MDTILNQTLKEVELILVDDGSTDGSGDLCDEYQEIDDRVIVIHKQNAGLGMARNTGLEIAQGKYIGFADSDDFIDINMYESLYKQMEKDQSDTCFCRYYNVSKTGKISVAPEAYKQTVYRGDSIKKQLMLGMIGALPESNNDVDIGMSVWKGLYSAEVIRQHKICFPSEKKYISEDIIFHMSYLQSAKQVSVIQNKYYYYCDNGSSLTKSYNAERFIKEKILFKKEEDELSKIFSEGEYKNRLYKAFIGRVRRCLTQEVHSNPNKKMANNNIMKICSDTLVQDILEDFKYQKINYKKQIINILIRKKCVRLIKIIFILFK